MLLRVEAAALNPHDIKLIQGELPHVAPPLPLVPGSDVAGVVVAGDSRFQPGARVFGIAQGALAEFARARAVDLTPMPAGFTFESCAALPVAGMTVLQAVRQAGGIRAGERLLVLAGTGGVGSLAIQIARAQGAEVWTTASPRNRAMLEKLGATRVIDPRRCDLAMAARGMDMVLDTLGGQATHAAARMLQPRGRIAAIVPAEMTGRTARALGLPLPAQFIFALKPNGLRKLIRVRKLRYSFTFMRPSQTDLRRLAELLASGRIRPVVDRVYPFAQAIRALQYLARGHARGKVVVSFPAASDHPLAT